MSNQPVAPNAGSPNDVAPNPVGRLRSLLFASAVRPEMVAKMPRSGTDGLVIDNEDATPAANKAEGRIQAFKLAQDFAASAAESGTDGAPQVFVRVNAVASEWFAQDVAQGLHPSIAGVVVPKIETLADMEAVGSALDAADLSHIGIVVGLETALGVADARPLLAHPRAVAGYFGAEDFVVDMGGVRTRSNDEVHYARSQVALAGRLAGIPVLDQVVADFGDNERFAEETAEARAMGYRGKLCIHPKQVTIANEGFVPSATEVERAERLLATYAEAQAKGLGAIAFEGQMIDEPLASQARQLLELAE